MVNKETAEKIIEIIKSERKLDVTDAAGQLGVDPDELKQFIYLSIGEGQFEGHWDGDDVFVLDSGVEYFASALDEEFQRWESSEQDGEGKVGDLDPSDAIQDAINGLIAITQLDDYAEFRAAFTERLRDDVTEEAFTVAQRMKEKHPIGPEVIDKEASEVVTAGIVKLRLQNGRVLTTMVKANDQWLADTIFFK